MLVHVIKSISIPILFTFQASSHTHYRLGWLESLKAMRLLLSLFSVITPVPIISFHLPTISHFKDCLLDIRWCFLAWWEVPRHLLYSPSLIIKTEFIVWNECYCCIYHHERWHCACVTRLVTCRISTWHWSWPIAMRSEASKIWGLLCLSASLCVAWTFLSLFPTIRLIGQAERQSKIIGGVVYKIQPNIVRCVWSRSRQGSCIIRLMRAEPKHSVYYRLITSCGLVHILHA